MMKTLDSSRRMNREGAANLNLLGQKSNSEVTYFIEFILYALFSQFILGFSVIFFKVYCAMFA